MAMESPLSLTLANIFCAVLKINFSNIPLIVTLSSIDGILMRNICCFPLPIMQKRIYLSYKHPNTNFLLEKENNVSLSFIGINVLRLSVVFILILIASYLKYKLSLIKLLMLFKYLDI